MTHVSPAAYLVWAIICTLLAGFLVYHLWSYDRFRCLRWNAGGSSGQFKRLMTYSYLASLPVIMTYSFGTCIIKYKEGFIEIPELGIIPKPYQLWEPAHQKAVFPLVLMFSLGWGFEMTTHLEELCFWLFLINSTASQQEWTKSLYFKVWACGSSVALLYVPLVTIFTRSDPLKNEAYTFLAGSLGSLSLTLWFMPILYTFRAFIQNLAKQGVDDSTIVRLLTFHELNKLRVIFRLLFVLPFVMLGADGLRPHVHINESMFGTDFLAVISAFGCAISSGITLIIFFPRSIDGEYRTRKAKLLEAEKSGSRRSPSAAFALSTVDGAAQSNKGDDYSSDGLEDDLADDDYKMPGANENPFSGHGQNHSIGGSVTWNDAPLRPNRRMDEEAAIDGRGTGATSQLSNGSRKKWVHPFLRNFKSPMDMVTRRSQSR